MGGKKGIFFRSKNSEPEKQESKRRFSLASAVLLISLSASCSPASQIPQIPQQHERAPIIAAEQPEETPGCRSDFSNLLRPGETVTESICLENTTYVLTDSSILIIPNSQTVESDELSITLSHTRVSIGNLIETGIENWTASEDMIFILTEDRRLNPIPRQGFAGARTRHLINGETDGAQMHFHEGLLFIGPVSEHLMIMSFSPEFIARAIPIPDQLCGIENPEFIASDGRLFFGNRDGKQVEIDMGLGAIGAITLQIR